MIRKTKIVCTLGPSSESYDVLKDMVLAGMTVARFNMAHGSYEEHQRRIDVVKAVREDLGRPKEKPWENKELFMEFLND